MSSDLETRQLREEHQATPYPERRPGELNVRELVRWGWRQVTSMRTALVLLLLLAIAAVPGSLIPQSNVDALKTTQWQSAHPSLTPVYQRLDLFDVYGSPWFSAIYLLLMLSLVGCIVPRLFVYLRHIRAKPPAAPRNLARLPDHRSFISDQTPEEVLASARTILGRRHRLRARVEGDDAVSAERGYLREVGNLVFHFSVLVVLVGFGIGSLYGYKGGVIVVENSGFSNLQTQYDDFDPGKLFSGDSLTPFHVDLGSFGIQWLTSGPRQGMALDFDDPLTYQASVGGPTQSYDLKVNHPLTIGNDELFLIGHGYAPEITVRDGNGKKVYSGPTVFLPQDSSFLSFGVVKVPNSPTGQVGLEGQFYPTYLNLGGGQAANVEGPLNNPVLSMAVYTGDLNMNSGVSQSVYSLDKADATEVMTASGTRPFLVKLSCDQRQTDGSCLHPQTVTLPNHLGTVTFDGVKQWTKIQISATPGKRIALGGVILALLGLLGSLFIRPRRTWVRARSTPGGTLVEVASLDRSGGGDIPAVIRGLVADLGGPHEDPEDLEDARQTASGPAGPADESEKAGS